MALNIENIDIDLNNLYKINYINYINNLNKKINSFYKNCPQNLLETQVLRLKINFFRNGINPIKCMLNYVRFSENLYLE